MATCVVGRCANPRDDPVRCYWKGEVLGSFLVLCRGHQQFFKDWWAMPEPVSFKEALKTRGSSEGLVGPQEG